MTDTVTAEALKEFIARAYEAVSVARADAALVAGLMTQADLNGSDGHGVFRLPQYIRRIRAGGMNPRPSRASSRSAPPRRWWMAITGSGTWRSRSP